MRPPPPRRAHCWRIVYRHISEYRQ
jgi:hypothetical protein